MTSKRLGLRKVRKRLRMGGLKKTRIKCHGIYSSSDLSDKDTKGDQNGSCAVVGKNELIYADQEHPRDDPNSLWGGSTLGIFTRTGKDLDRRLTINVFALLPRASTYF